MPSDKRSSDDHKKEPLFQSFFKLQKDPVFILQHDTFKILDLNDRAAVFFHSSPSELKKKFLYALTPDKEQKKSKAQLELHQDKELFQVDLPLKLSPKSTQVCPITLQKLVNHKGFVFSATVDVHSQDQISLIKTLKNQNRQFAEQIKKMVDINRKVLHSYESVKKQYEQLLQYQEENIKTERQSTIGEMVDVFQDKVNKPLMRILDDIQKINDTEKKLSPNVVKRLKLIEESVENIMRVIGRIAEVKDIKKMRYIELSNT